MQNNKLSIGVVFGGRSGEFEVSLVSATSIITSLDKHKYDVIPIGISRDGRWFSSPDVLMDFKSCKCPGDKHEVTMLPLPTKKGIYFMETQKFANIDVVFPIVHGTYGEDGTIQGLFEMAGMPYVGAGVMGSSIGMDKIIQKDIAKQAGIPIAPFLWFTSEEYKVNPKELLSHIKERLGLPCFVKPSNSGSSVGIAKAHNQDELIEAIEDAMKYDRRILIEKAVEKARELEVAILGNDNPQASCVGEIVPSNEFYDYNAKYVDGKSKTFIPADLKPEISARVQNMAITAFKILDISGMARVDFLYNKEGIFFNEVNTIPGFTSISMYPKLWKEGGLSYPALLDKLICLALEKNKRRTALLTSYRPEEDWFKG